MFASAVCLCLLLSGTHLRAGTDPVETSPQVTALEDGGVYRVAARFVVPQHASVAFEVLTDYEQIPRFMPAVKTSIVRERFPAGLIVEQEAVARVMMFSKRIHLRLEVHADGDTVRFRDCSGLSVSRYEGAWELALGDRATVVTYELTARPSLDVPGFLLQRLMKRDATRMIARPQTEIAARAATRH